MTLIRRVVGKRSLAEFDAFPKIPETYTESTAAGGTVSIFSYFLIIILVYFEIMFFWQSKINFYYKVDTDFDSKLKINVDITVAMPCDIIGSDIIDTTNTNNAYVYGRLIEEPAYFELTRTQRVHWNAMRDVNNYLRNVHHSIRDFLWKQDISSREYLSARQIPPSDVMATSEPDACRIHGSLTVNKVAGNFHITIGKHIPLPIGHAHISLAAHHMAYNFSHRIEKFSFGEHIPSILNPLEGEEKIATSPNQLYQYYIKVISTDVQTYDFKGRTYQYSTTEKDRVIDHSKDSHGTPAIHFKYDIDAIGVRVLEERIPFWKFLIRLCGIIGGVFATSGLVNTIVTAITDLVTCKYLSKVRVKVDDSFPSMQTVPQTLSTPLLNDAAL
ncbi:endoplasmic reticulum-Golgi intermediate compartment protein 2-like protein [Leptotrombidium deliense]|uniref:Endoplasmic reticulum-Golgi intermediate compartment protein 2-like protein n=1 Tax=Leptotrombidium deliense TaxID=299467 RepID=A0A443S3W7_9ACAR|nr:endoplasmic reticulum-Golgi intermediate compartment protein 2-like protein [Leptotrombidium deliense]